MTGITALLLFAAWTLVVMMIYVGYRVALVLTLKKPANAWPRTSPAIDPAFIVRAHHAHLNCVENLPVFAAVVLSGVLIGKAAVVDQVALYFIIARVAQSTIHLISSAAWPVFIRANLFLVQVALVGYMIWGLLN